MYKYSSIQRYLLIGILLLLLMVAPNDEHRLSANTVGAASICDGVVQIPRAQCDALVALYNSTNGTAWSNDTNWLQTTTPCSWYGVTCSGGNVTELSLSYNNLNGQLPAQLGDLTRLTKIHINGLSCATGGLSGPIPPELGNLTLLQELRLGSNDLSGSIPTTLGNLTPLSKLYLECNELTGPIPASLGSLSSLGQLWLEKNHLTGAIPSTLGNLSNLWDLNLDYNQLGGNIPVTLANLSAIDGDHLTLNYNKLNATDPVIIDFLNSIGYTIWKNTQTLPPTNIQATALSSNTVRVSWTPILYTSGTGKYIVKYATTSGGPYTTGCSTTNKTATNCQVSGLSGNTTYYFVVQSNSQNEYNNNLYSSNSAEVSTKTLAPPAPTLSTPTNGAVLKDTTPTFTWKAVAGATSYRIQVDDNDNFSSPAINIIATSTSYTPTTGLNNRPYYWRVRALVNGVWTPFSVRWNFIVDTLPPATPVLISPANNASITDSTPLFRWNAAVGAVKYTLQMDDNSNFASPIINRTLTTTSYTQPSVLADKPYYWRVRAQDQAGNISAWSANWSFVVNASPIAQPTLIPTNTPRPTRAPSSTPIPTLTATIEPTATATEIISLLPVVESDQAAVQLSGVWTSYDDAAASGGRYLLSSTAADSLTLGFAGSEVTIIYIKHPAVGSFAVEVDGVLRQTVNSAAAEAVFGAEVTITGLAYGQHMVRVYPVSGVVAIDAFRVETVLEVVIPTETPVRTDIPTDIPTVTPVPTDLPTETPLPTEAPTETPTDLPTEIPTELPTNVPTDVPTETPVPTDIPTEVPTEEVLPPAESTEEPAS